MKSRSLIAVRRKHDRVRDDSGRAKAHRQECLCHKEDAGGKPGATKCAGLKAEPGKANIPPSEDGGYRCGGGRKRRRACQRQAGRRTPKHRPFGKAQGEQECLCHRLYGFWTFGEGGLAGTLGGGGSAAVVLGGAGGVGLAGAEDLDF
jgi:hypothetical protein